MQEIRGGECRSAAVNVAGISVKAASLSELVDLCIDSFDETGGLIEDSRLPRVFFLMHKWFTEKSSDLANLFCSKFLQLYKSSSCSNDVDDDDADEATRRCVRLCYALRYWMRNFPVHFDLDRELATVMLWLQRFIKEDAAASSALQGIIDTANMPTFDWMRHISVRHRQPQDTRRISLVFEHIEPRELADHLTYIEYKNFRRLGFSEFKSYARNGKIRDNPKLERSVAMINGLSQWIQCLVLCRTTPEQRAKVIEKFVRVAQRLFETQNFNTLMSVVGGLSHSSLARLSRTKLHISIETQKDLDNFVELLSSKGNFSNYRKKLGQCQGFCIPILGVHLKDLIGLNTAFPDETAEKLINFRKMAQMSFTIEQLTQLHNFNPPVAANMDLVNVLKASLDIHYTEEEIYELSLAREPKSSVASQNQTNLSVGKSTAVVFADWAAGAVSLPDPETISKHVNAMIEAVFKNYDSDHDGLISQEEFQAITGNFPFMDSFCVLDMDKDGMISKEEMKEYFIKANHVALRNHFCHDFHEHTYFKPTFCTNCTGLLWGLIRQGVKCKICGINSHRHCKDLIVVECRLKGLNRSNSSPGREVTVERKMKISQRHKRRKKSSVSSTSSQVSVESERSASTSSAQEQCDQERLLASAAAVARDEGGGGTTKDRLSPRTSVSISEYSGGSNQNWSELRLEYMEQEKEALKGENLELKEQLKRCRQENERLQLQIKQIRDDPVSFILNQMDTLNIDNSDENNRARPSSAKQ